MACRGVHFAITGDDLARLLHASNDDEVVAIAQEIEEHWDEDYVAESDKAWDAIHRCLTDGSLLFESGEYPLNHVICGGRQLFEGDEYVVSLVTPEQVVDVANSLKPITKEWMRQRYLSIDPDEYPWEIGEEDFAYIWDWFQNVRELYLKAAAADRAVIFTVDQ